MVYQSEAALEGQFIEQLKKQGYQGVEIPDYDALVANFKVRFGGKGCLAVQGNWSTGFRSERLGGLSSRFCFWLI